MTDYSELIKQARAVPGPTLLMTYPAQTTPDPLSNALADALEAQAKELAEKDARIAELEAELSACQKGNDSYHDQLIAEHNRSVDMKLLIEELEEALRSMISRSDAAEIVRRAALKRDSVH